MKYLLQTGIIFNVRVKNRSEMVCIIKVNSSFFSSKTFNSKKSIGPFLKSAQTHLYLNPKVNKLPDTFTLKAGTQVSLSLH